MKKLILLALSLALSLTLLMAAPALAQTVNMKAPGGIAYFIDRDGNKIIPDGQGHVSVPYDQVPAYERAGFERLNYFLMKGALSGDLVLVVTPATLTTTHTSTAWTRSVTVQLQNAAGEVQTWYNRAVATGVSVGDTSTAGTATIASTTLTFVNGVATVVVSGDAQAWLAVETDTLTVAQETICGYTVASKTSIETFN